MQQLLESGVHFGHQTRSWNPHMRPFIFGERNGVHIIDLAQTVVRLDAALEKIKEVSASGDKILFVGTKKQARMIIQREAESIGMPYVNNRWLGGTLTNFSTLSKRIEYYNELSSGFDLGTSDEIKTSDSEDDASNTDIETKSVKQTKKERVMLQKEFERLTRSFSGLRSLERTPGALFIVDPALEEIAVREANRAKIPVIAMCDTNANPDLIDYPIPSNDDAIRAIELMTKLVSKAIREGVAVSNIEQEFQEAAESSSPETPVNTLEGIGNAENEQQVQVESNDTEQ
ncbi:MAG: 30S ribosomal protein S2 [Chloroflexi bacterium]|nr:30S ribosomal protein S2 [Chloroflexota bacterium]|tara:strand:- start:4630 stop:5493 length:864 start_codon:yes stop_codon:yes gene_type:complete